MKEAIKEYNEALEELGNAVEKVVESSKALQEAVIRLAIKIKDERAKDNNNSNR